MGMITIEIAGSFVKGQLSGLRRFSAIKNGHAHAVAEAIEWLSAQVLPNAIAQDHKLQANGEFPLEGFSRK